MRVRSRTINLILLILVEKSFEIKTDLISRLNFLDHNLRRTKGSSRIVNAEESTKNYPWLVFVIRTNQQLLKNDLGINEKTKNRCGGTIISINM